MGFDPDFQPSNPFLLDAKRRNEQVSSNTSGQLANLSPLGQYMGHKLDQTGQSTANPPSDQGTGSTQGKTSMSPEARRAVAGMNGIMAKELVNGLLDRFFPGSGLINKVVSGIVGVGTGVYTKSQLQPQPEQQPQPHPQPQPEGGAKENND